MARVGGDAVEVDSSKKVVTVSRGPSRPSVSVIMDSDASTSASRVTSLTGRGAAEDGERSDASVADLSDVLMRALNFVNSGSYAKVRRWWSCGRAGDATVPCLSVCALVVYGMLVSWCHGVMVFFVCVYVTYTRVRSCICTCVCGCCVYVCCV